MRKIKFRAWDEKSKVMIYGVEKFYDTLGVFLDGDGKELDLYEDTSIWNLSSFGNFIEYEISLNQYTGLKDKNGKEIYEDDIVYGSQGLFDGGRVYFYEGQYLIENSHCQGCPLPKQMEVIGNIYENPELFKK